MEKFIEEVEFDYDPQPLIDIHEKWRGTDALTQTGQLSINNRGYNELTDLEQLANGRGGVQQYYRSALKEEYAKLEMQWSKINEIFEDTYLHEIYNRLEQMFDLGRMRFLCLGVNSCYTYHQDATIRFHIPLYTNDECIFFDENYTPYHMPVGKIYLVDTTKFHTAANFGKHERLHIVGAVNR